jgi:hypothetical protein
MTSYNASGQPLFEACFLKTKRTKFSENWKFFAADKNAAMDYIRSKPGYEKAEICWIKETDI